MAEKCAGESHLVVGMNCPEGGEKTGTADGSVGVHL